MNIRKAVSSDAPEIAAVHIKSWRTTYKGIISDAYLSTLSYNKRKSQWRERLDGKNETNFTYITERSPGKIIGFALGRLEQYDREEKGFKEGVFKGELMAIYLLKEYQRKGIGRMLVLKIINHLLENGVTSMITWALKENHSSEFYKSLGGRFVGEKIIEIGGMSYIECAYGWDDLTFIPYK